MMRSKGVLVVACVLGAASLLTGCSNSKKQSDLAMQEAAELRERNATLEQNLREKDARIAELETAMNQPQAPATNPGWGNTAPATAGFPADSGWAPSNAGGSQFEQNDRGEMVATIAGNVLFDSGSATIKSSARRQLDRIAEELNRTYRGAAIRIEGHTDSDPIRRSRWASNEALSQARADAVKQYLSSKGVSAARMNSIGYGAAQPKATKAASRRVEIVVTR